VIVRPNASGRDQLKPKSGETTTTTTAAHSAKTGR
jgi:hypothetical protein